MVIPLSPKLPIDRPAIAATRVIIAPSLPSAPIALWFVYIEGGLCTKKHGAQGVRTIETRPHHHLDQEALKTSKRGRY